MNHFTVVFILPGSVIDATPVPAKQKPVPKPCLEGEKGGVRYRKLRVQNLDKKPPEGPRSPWMELFDGEGFTGWTASGSVSVGSGAMELDGNKGRAEVRLEGQAIADGALELDLWCRRSGESRAPYRVGLRADSSGAGACFTVRPECVVAYGPPVFVTFSRVHGYHGA